MGDYFGKMMEDLLGGLLATIAAVAVVFFCLGALAVWGLPKAWAWFVPWLHAITA